MNNYFESTEWTELKKSIDEKLSKEKIIKQQHIKVSKEQLESALSFFMNKKIKLPEPKVDFTILRT